jgi:uncharacterized protein
MPQSAINWFEIPVTNMDRAVRFYNSILGIQLEKMEVMGATSAFFPYETEGVGGSLTMGDGYVPSQTGAVIYLNGGQNLSTVLDRVEAAGGQIMLPKTSIGENGYIAFFIDTEGNKIGLHSGS